MMIEHDMIHIPIYFSNMTKMGVGKIIMPIRMTLKEWDMMMQIINAYKRGVIVDSTCGYVNDEFEKLERLCFLA